MLAEHLKDRELLLVLDNYEQVTDAAPVVADLLTAAPGLKVLATSRIPLHIYGEHEFPVPPLGASRPAALPDAEAVSQYEAVALFIDRARAAKPDFVVTNENAPAVAEICYRLDGLPLALELAASRVKLLSPQAMLPKLEHRLQLLTTGARDLPERQRTLRGAIEWSHDLLDDAAPRPVRAAGRVHGRGDVRGRRRGGQPRRRARHRHAGRARQPGRREPAAPAGGGRRGPVHDAGDDPRVRRGTARAPRSTPTRSGGGTRRTSSPWPRRPSPI